MKLQKLLLCAVLLLPLVGGGAVYAQHDTTGTGDEPVSSQTTTDTTTPKTREQRITEHKAKMQERLTQVRLNQVKLRCKAANGLIKSAHARIGSFEAKRTKVHSNLVTRLQELSPKLRAAGIDTATYDEQVATLKTKADAYSAAVAELKQGAGDLADMDCAADPEGFMATLMEVRELRGDVIEKGQDFRKYLKDTLKPTLVAIRSQVEAKKTESGM